MSRASPIRSSAPGPSNDAQRRLPFGGEVMRWLFTGKGMLTCSPSIVAASSRSWTSRRPPMCNAPSRRAAPERPDRRARGNTWYYGDSLLISCPAIARKKRVG